MTKKNNYSIFVCSDQGYLPFLNVLLNSIDKYQLNVPVNLLYYNVDNNYIKKIQNVFSYDVLPTEIKSEDFSINKFNQNNKNLFIKQSRFKYIRELGEKYDVICMLDADMFIVSKNILNLFDLVKDTNKMIGCNERYKWTFDKKYQYENTPIFDTPVKANKFHCSVPIIFDLKKWTDVFDFYNKLSLNSFEVNVNNQIKPIGDIYCWNISVYKNKRENDVVLFPMETMTQVHQTNTKEWTRIIKDNDFWKTFAGDEVFSIHGRIGNSGWGKMHYNKLKETNSISKKELDKTLSDIKQEWISLNTEWKVDIRDFLLPDMWKQFESNIKTC